MSHDDIQVSTVIVSYNTCNITDECIASVKAQTRCSHEIIVVDNNSTDDTLNMLKTKYPEVTLIKNPSNTGFAKANNQGFAIAKGKYFFMLNPDTVILDRAIDKLVGFMENNPDVGACGPRNYSPDMELQHNCDHFPSIWKDFTRISRLSAVFPNSKLFNAAQMKYWNYSGSRKVDRITGCSLMIRSDIYKRLGGLDSNYFMYCEETDLCYQMRKSGQSVVYFPEAAIIHYGGESAKKDLLESYPGKTNWDYFIKSKYYFYEKNYSLLHAMLARAFDLCHGLIYWLTALMQKNSSVRACRIQNGRSVMKRALTKN